MIALGLAKMNIEICRREDQNRISSYADIYGCIFFFYQAFTISIIPRDLNSYIQKFVRKFCLTLVIDYFHMQVRSAVLVGI